MINCSGNKGATFFPPLDAAYEFFCTYTHTYIFTFYCYCEPRAVTRVSEANEWSEKSNWHKRHLTTFSFIFCIYGIYANIFRHVDDMPFCIKRHLTIMVWFAHCNRGRWMEESWRRRTENSISPNYLLSFEEYRTVVYLKQDILCVCQLHQQLSQKLDLFGPRARTSMYRAAE